MSGSLNFLSGGGEVGELIRSRDWKKTVLGDANQWPQSLKTTLSIVVNSKFPIFLFWGPELICFYNDAYLPSLTNGKHPSMLGGRGEEQFSEIWHIIKPMIDQVISGGESFRIDNQLIPIFRNNQFEDAYWSLNYSAVTGESGKPAGVFVTWQETTDQLLSKSKLEESKNELEFAIDAANLGTWDYNPITNAFSSNNRLKEWFGLPAEERIELAHAVNAIHPRDSVRVAKAIEKALDFASGGKYDIEYTIVHPVTGKETIVRAKGRAWFNDQKLAYRFNGTLEDVTERAIAQNEIRESEQRYQNLITSSPVAIGILKGPEFVVTNANEAIIKYWGKGWEIIGKKYFEALPELIDQGYREVFNSVYQTGNPFNAVETPVSMTQNGIMQLRYYNFLLYAQKNLKGETEGIGIIASEVTSQALFNKQLRENEKRFRLLADSMPQHIWTSDVEGNLNYYNQSVFDYSGLTLEQINKDGWIQIVHPDDRPANIREWTKAIQTGNDFLLEHRFRKHTGEYRWQLSRAIPQRDESGKIQAWVGTSTDIQDQKDFAIELERQVAERTRELAENNVALEKMNKELESFAYISSHDLQEPLRKIQTFASQLRSTEADKLSEGGKDKFERMQNAAKRMQTLIEDLLIYSRTKTSERTYEHVHLGTLVDEVKDDLKEELQQKGAIIDSSEMCELNVIPFQFRQLLLNLISNSLKFAKENETPHIRITSVIEHGQNLNNEKIEPTKDYCHIQVSDNGIGFDPQYRDRIFDVFQRLHTKTKYSGTGIGLAIVKTIVENHNGVIEAISEPDKGATFNIYIPVVE